MTTETKHATETLPVKEALSAILSKCDCCGKRRPYAWRKWCKPCILKWQRDPDKKGKQYTGRINDLCPNWQDEIPERYVTASLADLPKNLVEQFLALPDDKGMFLWGQPGTGKTHSMCAFAKHLWSEGWEVLRITYESLSLQVRDCYRSDSTESELSLIESFGTISKLFIEDVGVTVSIGQQESDFSLRLFQTILDKRLEQCVATFITSNKSVEELGKSFDQRVSSRLYQACDVVQLTGTDKRKQAS